MELPEAARTSKTIGKVGEKFVGLWASQAGITSTLVQEDENGWDYYLELPRGSTGSSPLALDLLPCTLSCFIQVKTITSGEKRSRIKLSNWQKMVSSLAPWFVLVLVLDEHNEANEAFLVHVDSDQVADILKRLRETPPEQLFQLHKHHLDVTWRDLHLLEPPYSAALDDALRRHIGADPAVYAIAKRHWIETVGYDEVVQQFRATVDASSADEAKEMMVDLVVGLREEVPCSALKTADIRFNIEGPMQNLGEGTLSVDLTPEDEAILELATNDGTERAVMKCDVFSSKPHLPDLEERFHKHRLVAPFFAVQFKVESALDEDSPGRAAFHLNMKWELGPIDWEGQHRLADLAAAGKACRILAKSQKEPVSITIQRRGRTILQRDNFQATALLDQGALAVWLTVVRAEQIARYYDLPDHLEVDLDTLMSRAKEVRLLADSLEALPRIFQWGATTTDSLALALDQPISLLSVCVIKMNDWTVARCIALVGLPQWSAEEDGTFRLNVPGAELRVVCDARISASIDGVEVFESLKELAMTQLNSEGIAVTVIPDQAL